MLLGYAGGHYRKPFPTTKRKFQTQKSPSNIPITRIPEFHSPPGGLRWTVSNAGWSVQLWRCLIILSPRQECTGSGSSKSNMEVCISGCVFSSLVYELENSRGDVVSGLSLACLQI